MENIEELIQDLEEDILDNTEDEMEDEKNGHSILYKKRLKKLIKDVAVSESFTDIKMGKPGLESMQNTIKFITVILVYEIINSLKKENKKIIKPKFIQDALSRTIVGADSLSFSISKLQELLHDLESQNNSTSIGKAVDFINIYDNSQDKEK